MDDTFVVVKKEYVGTLHSHLNNQVSGVSFTVEEKEGAHPFLGVDVRWDENGSLRTAVFRKMMHMDRYLNVKSHHSARQKESVIQSW